MQAKQLWILIAIGVVLWLGAALAIRWLPQMVTDPVQSAVSFVTAFPIGWACVKLTQSLARLATSQLLAGVSIVAGLAMMLDGAVLHWAPQVYGSDDTTIRLGAAWLLWGYGVSLVIAATLVARETRTRAA